VNLILYRVKQRFSHLFGLQRHIWVGI